MAWQQRRARRAGRTDGPVFTSLDLKSVFGEGKWRAHGFPWLFPTTPRAGVRARRGGAGRSAASRHATSPTPPRRSPSQKVPNAPDRGRGRGARHRTRTHLHGLRVVHGLDGVDGTLLGRVGDEGAACTAETHSVSEVVKATTATESQITGRISTQNGQKTSPPLADDAARTNCCWAATRFATRPPRIASRRLATWKSPSSPDYPPPPLSSSLPIPGCDLWAASERRGLRGSRATSPHPH